LIETELNAHFECVKKVSSIVYMIISNV